MRHGAAWTSQNEQDEAMAKRLRGISARGIRANFAWRSILETVLWTRVLGVDLTGTQVHGDLVLRGAGDDLLQALYRKMVSS